MSEWSEKKLGDIAETTSGGTPDRKNQAFFGGPIPWVKSGELEDTFINDTEEKITPEGLKRSAAKLFPSGTLLMAMYGATVGKTALLKIEAATNQAVCAIFPKADQAGTDFLRYALVYQRPEILKLRYGGAQPNISQQVIRNLVVPLPPLAEQRKISGVLGLVQRALEQQERLIALTTELKKALLYQLFTQGLRGEPQKQTEIGPVPQSWEVVKFAEVVDIKNGQVDPTVAPFDAMLHVGPENIESNTGRLTELRNNAELRISSGNYHFTPDDVLYSKIRPYLNKAALPDFEGTCSADMYPLRAKAGQFIRTYLFQMLLSEPFKKQAVSFQDRTGIPKINRAQLGSILLPRPSITEQQDISDCLATCDRKVEVHFGKHAALTALFRTLLHQLMTAQLRVHALDLSEIPEHV